MRRPAVIVGAFACLVVLIVAYFGFTTSSGEAGPRRIAFVADPGHQVWLSDLSGKNRRRLGPGDGPLLAPNGDTVAASLPGTSGNALVIYPASGSPRKLFDAGKVDATPQAWSPDSRYLAVVLANASPGIISASGIAIVDTTSGDVKTIARGEISGASFAPDSGRIVYGMARSPSIRARFDVFSSALPGGDRQQLTHDGHSLNPVWGPTAIAYDRERQRSSDAPVYEVWLMAPDGSGQRQLTHVPVPSLRNGLVPLAFSNDGRRLLARFEGVNTSQTWTIATDASWVRELTVGGESVRAGGISRDGSTVLVDRGGFLNSPGQGTVETLPFYGGTASSVIARAAEPSWNR